MVAVQAALGITRRLPTRVETVPTREWVLSGLVPFGARWSFERVVCSKKRYLRVLVKCAPGIRELTPATASCASSAQSAAASCVRSTRLSRPRRRRGTGTGACVALSDQAGWARARARARTRTRAGCSDAARTRHVLYMSRMQDVPFLPLRPLHARPAPRPRAPRASAARRRGTRPASRPAVQP